MTESTIGLVAEKLDQLSAEVHEIRLWLVGNGNPDGGIFGSIRELQQSAHDHASGADQRNGMTWNWRRLSFDVLRNVATVLVIAVVGWVVTTVGLHVSVSLQ